MGIDDLRDLADHVAELLPNAPAEGDTMNWLGWRELVWDTACSVAELAGDALDDTEFATNELTHCCDAVTERVSASEILGLATLFREQHQTMTGEHAF